MNPRPAIATVTLAALAACVVAGPLDPPPGPITGTYKTLNEVEPRTPIGQATTPGDLTCVFKITQPGSYYLAGDVQGASGKHGIVVAASDVTIDLQGFSLRGLRGGSASLHAITTDANPPSPRRNITVRNGSVILWGSGGIALSGGGSGDACTVEDVRLTSLGAAGISLGIGGVVRRCSVDTAASYGIFAVGRGALISGCTVRATTTFGIITGDSAVIRDCTASDVTGEGIVASAGSVVESCSAVLNTSTGIEVDGAVVRGCTALLNGGDGIGASGNCVITGNTCSQNGSGAAVGAGIHLFFGDNRVEGNNLTNNERGLWAVSSGNFIVRNTASGNSMANWEIVAGNAVGPIVNAGVNAAAISGNTYAGSLGSTDPNANFTY